MLIVSLTVGSDSDDEVRLDRATRTLHGELRSLDVEFLEPYGTGAAPEGARSAEAFTLGALVLAVAPSIVEQVANLVRDWVRRNDQRQVQIRVVVGSRAVEAVFDADVNEGKVVDLIRKIQAMVES